MAKSLHAVKSAAVTCLPLAIMALCLFGAAGRLDWPNAFVLLGVSLLSGLASMVGRDPQLAAERKTARPEKGWDKVLLGITVLVGPMAMWIAAGLEQRFHPSDGMPAMVSGAGVAAALLAAALIVWAMRANRFFSTVVRIQKDRGHTVMEGGPYGFIRHPGYAGMAVFTLATPLILGSYWALAPAVATAWAVGLRTALEDVTLHRELDGYADYARRVRSRLLPAIW